MTTSETTRWLTTDGAAEHIQRPAQFIRRVADSGELHGHQRPGRNGCPISKSRWSFSAAAVDTFVRGGDEQAQRVACGCLPLGTGGERS